jgi:diguanylate cyclase (GGDEF)-like protein
MNVEQARQGEPLVRKNHFKHVNDTYGHLAGDTVLRAVAAAITDTVRDYDIVARFGGDEFLVLLPDTTPADTSAIADRIRATITTLRVTTEHHRGDNAVIDNLTASIGTAGYPDDGTTAQTLLQHADDDLYAAKNTSRDNPRAGTRLIGTHPAGSQSRSPTSGTDHRRVQRGDAPLRPRPVRCAGTDRRHFSP